MSINWNRFLFVFINYSINQNYCYILIIPAFGIVSQIVSTFSSKPIFGQCGPKYFIYILKHTICRKVRNIKKQNTILVSHLEIILKLLRTNLMIILLTFSPFAFEWTFASVAFAMKWTFATATARHWHWSAQKQGKQMEPPKRGSLALFSMARMF